MKRIVNPCVCSTYYGDAKAYAKKSNTRMENLVFAELLVRKGMVIVREVPDNALMKLEAVSRQKIGQTKCSRKFCDIWDRWHLNDTNPCCEHQRELGWLDKAKEYVTLYHFRLKREVIEAQEAAKKEAITALKEGRTFKPTEEQTRLANLTILSFHTKKIRQKDMKLESPCIQVI